MSHMPSPQPVKNLISSFKCEYPIERKVRDTKSFEEYADEATSWSFSGWDFSVFNDRIINEPEPWDYSKMAKELSGKAGSMLDIGTGGGEVLSTLGPFPSMTCATEGFPPNVPVASKRLTPLGIHLVQTYCDENWRAVQHGNMPFSSNSAQLIVDRHESFVASGIERILKPGGTFLTQQVGNLHRHELNDFLNAPQKTPNWNLKEAMRQVSSAGLTVTSSGEARFMAVFRDIGAVIGYLRMAPWQIMDFEISLYRERLVELDRQIRKNGGFETYNHIFFVKAEKR